MQDNNPLAIFQRKPQPLLKLPSNGRWWAPNSLENNSIIEVLSMTGRDEFMLLNANPILLNSVLVELIQRCIPAVKDAWQMPKVDMDAAIIAIRIASYGNMMKTVHQCPNCKADNIIDVDLHDMIDNITLPDFDQPIYINDDIAFYVKPTTMKDSETIALSQTRRLALLAEITKQDINQEEQAKLINDNLWQLTDDAVKMMSYNIDRVIAKGAVVSDPQFIQQWIMDADRESYDKINRGINDKLDEYKMPRYSTECSACGTNFQAEIEFLPNEFLSSEQNQGS